MELYITLVIIANVASVVLCGSVIVTFLSFDILHKKQYMIVVYYMSVALFFMAVGSLLLKPPDGSIACWTQALFTKIFIVSAVMWGCLLSFLMLHVTVYAKKFELSWKHHLVCWGFPLLLALLPLIHCSYGYEEARKFCWLVANKNTSLNTVFIWHIMTYYFPIGVCFVLMVFNIARCTRFYLNVSHGPVKACLSNMIQKLCIFPITFLLCWLMVDQLQLLGHALKGLACGIAFWLLNPELRSLWSIYFSFIIDVVRRVGYMGGIQPDTLNTPANIVVLDQNIDSSMVASYLNTGACARLRVQGWSALDEFIDQHSVPYFNSSAQVRPIVEDSSSNQHSSRYHGFVDHINKPQNFLVRSKVETGNDAVAVEPIEDAGWSCTSDTQGGGSID